MNRHKSTISREHKRGSVQQINKNRKAFTAYFPDAGACVYRENRTNCGAPSVVMKARSFLRFAETKILKDNWSPDAVVGMAKRSPEWKNSFIPCTKTIYNLIDTGELSVINMDLFLKVKRSTKKKRPHEINALWDRVSRRAAHQLRPVKNLDTGKSIPLLERNPMTRHY